MPIATGTALALGAGVGAAGAGAQASGGKKARRQANTLAQQQLDLQRQQLAQSQQLIALGKTAWTPARDYWQALLQGGQPARVATGPYAEMIGTQGAASRQSIQQGLPRGGERNLALAQSQIGQQRDISRLYAGMQPTAASALGALAGLPMGSGAGLFPQANIGGALQNYQFNQGVAMDSASGFGRLLYNAMNKNQQGGFSGPPGILNMGSSLPLFGSPGYNPANAPGASGGWGFV